MIKIVEDAYLFKGALSEEQQRAMIALYKDNLAHFYVPKLKSGHPMSLKMACFGHHWSALDYKYHQTRTDADMEDVKAFPDFLQQWAEPFSLACFPNEKPEWDICIANYYGLTSRLGMHSDNSESGASLQGKPIVSFSVGADCIFKFGGPNRNDSYVDVRLSGGDAFVFGGSARKNYHGVSKIFLGASPFNNDLDFGRLNFTLRKL